MFEDIRSLYNVCLKTASSGEATVYLKGENNTNFTTTIQGLTAGQDTITNTPVVNPYGFASIPDNQSYTAVIGNLGIRNQIPVVLGYTNSVKEASPLDMDAGETALYNSTDFSLELKLTELRARFNGISSKVINGDAGQRLYSDLFGEMIALFQALNDRVTLYNAHIHDVGGASGGTLFVTIPPLVIDSINLVVVAPSGGGTCSVTGTTTSTAITLAIPPAPPVPPSCPTTPPLVPMTPYTFTKPIVSDNTYVNNELLYIDNNGVMPT